MALREILLYPDARLRNVATPVTQFDIHLKKLIDDMFETMYHDDGVGLAATQINVQSRIIVIDQSDDHKSPIILINPEIIEKKGISSLKEGCLSVPGVYECLNRAEYVKVKTHDLNGNVFEIEGEDLLSVCIQHEIDHLDGKLLIDTLSRLKQMRIKDKLIKYKNYLASRS